MIYILLIFQAALVLGIVLFTLGFLITSLKENEPRAAMMAGVLSVFLIGLELGIYFLYTLGFFFHFVGMLMLVGAWLATGAVTYFLCQRTGLNQRALKGVDGYIVGQAQRFDEREQVFARERTLRPDSAQYKEFYRTHPELEQVDSERRKAGGLLGIPGNIDRPGETSNVSAMSAAFSIPPHFGRPESHSPTIAAIGGNRPSISPEAATLRVKGFTRHLGAGLVGVTKMNPLWVYSHRGEIFYENWEQWGEEIAVDHPFAIVFAVEMDREMVYTAPHTPSVAESALSYSKGTWISTQSAA